MFPSASISGHIFSELHQYSLVYPYLNDLFYHKNLLRGVLLGTLCFFACHFPNNILSTTKYLLNGVLTKYFIDLFCFAFANLHPR